MSRCPCLWSSFLPFSTLPVFLSQFFLGFLFSRAGFCLFCAFFVMNDACSIQDFVAPLLPSHSCGEAFQEIEFDFFQVRFSV